MTVSYSSGRQCQSSLWVSLHCQKREELDGRNSSLYKDFYEKAADRFNEKEWIPNSLVLPNLHEDFK